MKTGRAVGNGLFLADQRFCINASERRFARPDRAVEQNIATNLPFDNELREKLHRVPLSFNLFEHFGAMPYCQTSHVISSVCRLILLALTRKFVNLTRDI